MTTGTRISTFLANAQAEVTAKLLNGGFIDVMTGEQPKNGGAPVSEDLRLSTSELSDRAVSSPEDGVLKANVIGKTIAIRRGEPTWARVRTKDGTPLVDMPAEDLGLKVNMFIEGQTVAIVEYTHRVVKGA